MKKLSKKEKKRRKAQPLKTKGDYSQDQFIENLARAREIFDPVFRGRRVNTGRLGL